MNFATRKHLREEIEFLKGVLDEATDERMEVYRRMMARESLLARAFALIWAATQRREDAGDSAGYERMWMADYDVMQSREAHGE